MQYFIFDSFTHFDQFVVWIQLTLSYFPFMLYKKWFFTIKLLVRKYVWTLLLYFKSKYHSFCIYNNIRHLFSFFISSYVYVVCVSMCRTKNRMYWRKQKAANFYLVIRFAFSPNQNFCKGIQSAIDAWNASTFISFIKIYFYIHCDSFTCSSISSIQFNSSHFSWLFLLIYWKYQICSRIFIAKHYHLCDFNWIL